MEKGRETKLGTALVAAVRAALLSATAAGDGRVRLKETRALKEAMEAYDRNTCHDQDDCG